MLTGYFAERLPPRLYLPVAAWLGMAASAGGWPGPRVFAQDVSFALLLLAQFRIWDDLADRRHDRVAHPRRTLSTPASARPLVVTCIILAGLNVALAVQRDGLGPPVIALLALNGLLAAWYAVRGARTAAGDHLLLAKYPAMVLVIAGQRLADAPAALSLAMAAVYLAACLYEVWHDPASPASRHRLLVASEAVLLVITLAVLSLGGHS